MTPLWTSEAIAAATGGTASSAFVCDGVAFDSRELSEGDLFVALKGEATDGHRFVATAFSQGAAGALVAEPVAGPHVLVADTAQALDALARVARARTSARIIGVTGSAGKTGTKEALFAALARMARGRAHRSVKSYNNHVGVPLSLARMPAEAAYGVFEMGMNHPGELAALTRLVRPHVAIVTTIAPAHAEFFKDETGIADAKSEIFEGLEPGGIAIVPADSPHRARLTAKAVSCGARVVSFGRADDADMRAIDVVPAADGGMLVTAEHAGGRLCFAIGAAGAHWVSNGLAVLAATAAVGGDLAVAALALAELEGLPGRGARHLLPRGTGDILLIDESYNANPGSMAATIAHLGSVRGRRRIVLLGEMRELGVGSADYHAALGPLLEAAGVVHALLVGDGMCPLASALASVPALKVDWFRDTDGAAAALDAILEPGDALLVKGSNAVGLSRVVAALTGDSA